MFVVVAQNVPTGLGLFDRRSSPPPQNQSVEVRHAFFHAPKRYQSQHGSRHSVRWVACFLTLCQREIVAGNLGHVKPLQDEKLSRELFSVSG